MNAADQFSFWRNALAGNPTESEKGNPRSGYWRSQSGDEVIAIWRDKDGTLQCERTKSRDRGASMTADEIDELFGWVSRYPIPFNLYVAVRDKGEKLPAEYCTRLSIDEIKRGVVWTPTLGKSKLKLDPEKYDEKGDARPSLGHNNPPPDATSPDKALAQRVHDLGVTLANWLQSIGGSVRTEAEAEILGGYKNKFRDLEVEAQRLHDEEKAPYLAKGKEIDAKWFAPVRDKATASKDKVARMIRDYEDAETARRAEEARIANEAAKKAAAAQAAIDGVTAEPIAEIVPEPARVASVRGGSRRPQSALVQDMAAFLNYCGTLAQTPPDIAEAAEKVARKWKAAGVKAPGMMTEKAA